VGERGLLPGRTPTVICDDVHVTYRVPADRERGTPSESSGRIARLARRGARRRPVREVHAVRGVSFTAYEGDAIGLVGRNGSGKSTLLRVIAGLLPPSSGRVWAHGQPSLLGVNAALMPELSGARNVVLGGLALGLSREEIDSRFDDIVDFAGVRDAIGRPMRTYSSGMGSRLRFAIATARTPPVLLVDEALATGDAEFRSRSEKRIRALREDAGTVFLVSHSLSSVRRSCNRALWIERGALRMDGGVDEVADAYGASVKR
jgi:teichoic acid transport system ATP-binding protein